MTMNFTKQSGVLPWQTTNITNAPSGSGVYVFRVATDLGSIIYIGSTDNLERRLNEHFLSGDVPGVLFFDWYEMDSVENARTLEKQWIIKYSPKYNDRVG